MSRQDEESIKSYLLGELTQSDAEQLEERILTDDTFANQVVLIEDELVEDFARGALSARERKQFQEHFLSTPNRQRKLMLVRALRKYSDNVGPVSDIQPAPSVFRRILSPQWGAPALAVLIVAVSAGVWWIINRQSPVDRGLVALNEAFAAQRPVQSRVTGMEYARYSVTRGDQATVNENALNRSTGILLIALDESPSAQTHHAVGRLYLLKENFERAITEFEEALKTEPNNPQLHSDLAPHYSKKER